MAAKHPSSKHPKKLPSKADILEFVRSGDGKLGKREIARAFGITGSDRIGLKALLKEMADEGLIEKKHRKKLGEPGKLPSVTVIEVFDLDTDGELMARPAKWDGEGPAPLIVMAPPQSDRGPTAAVGDRLLARLRKLDDPDSHFSYEAKTIKKLGAGAKRALGVLKKQGKMAIVSPVDKSERREYQIAPDDMMDAKDGDLVSIEILSQSHHNRRKARIVASLGKANTPKTTSLIAIHAHGLPTEFSDATLAEAETIQFTPGKDHEDLRHIPFVTIDPEDARDFDDAVFAERDTDDHNKGGYRLYVAIADVAAHVRPGTALDKDALKRGNSAYFPDRVVPMLPERLSNDLCSLRPEEDRPAMVAEITINQHGEKTGQIFRRGIIRSRCRLTYQNAQTAFDSGQDKALDDVKKESLDPVLEAYEKLRDAREKRKPLDLDLPERRIELGDDGRVAKVRKKERLEAHRLIEEYMITANVAAAEALEKRKVPLLYRAHEAPTEEKISSLIEFLSTLDLKLARGQNLRPGQLNQILDKARQMDRAEMVSEVVLRSQTQAYYTERSLGHFGLNLRRYAHFTSPIRRYADLIVHRALIKAFKLGKDGLTDQEIESLHEIGEDISNTERRAMAAERDSIDRYIAAYMEPKIGLTFDGRISGVTRFGLFVQLEETGADGLVPIRTLPGGYFTHDEHRHRLIDEDSGLSFTLGETVTVRLEEATPLTGGLRFELVEGGAIVKKKDRHVAQKSKRRRVGFKRKPKGPRKR